MCGGLCVEGQYCWNGVCVDGCLTNDNCADDQYCLEDEFFDQGKCVPKEAQGCANDDDCEGAQVCQKGACVTPVAEEDQPTDGCQWKPDFTDGCPDSQVCFEEYDEEGKLTDSECYAMPACGEDGSCPIDVEGGVCNEKADGKKIIPTKARICLMGLCLSNADCPTTMMCYKFAGDIGGCMEKGLMCESDEDCDEGEKCDSITDMCAPDMGGGDGCDSDEDCDDGWVCDDFAKQCVPDMEF